MISHALRMISSRRSNYSLGSLFGGKREQLVQRATLLESAGSLLIIELKEDLAIGKRRKGFRVSAGRNSNGCANAAQRCLNILDSDHSVRAAILHLVLLTQARRYPSRSSGDLLSCGD